MDKNKILNRLKAINGQLQLVINMVENKRDYFSVMQQSMAVNGGLKKLNYRILQFHLYNHTFKRTNEDEQKQDLNKIMQIFKKCRSYKP